MAAQLSVSSTNAGTRGRAWRCWECPYIGERHAVRKHCFEKHILISDWPYYCQLCDYSHHNYTTFSKHVRWYQLHIERARGRPSFRIPLEHQANRQSEQYLSLMEQLSVEDSRAHWASVTRKSKAASNTTATSSDPLVAVPSCSDSSSLPSDAVVFSSPAIPLLPEPSSEHSDVSPIPVAAAMSSPVKFTEQEQAAIDEFHFEPVTECELESINTRTENKETNTDPLPDFEAKCKFLEGLVQSQQRTIEENTSAIHMMRKMLEEKGLTAPDSGDRLLHHGVGSGEPPSVTRRARSPVRPRVRSVVYAPARQRPRPPGEAPTQVIVR